MFFVHAIVPNGEPGPEPREGDRRFQLPGIRNACIGHIDRGVSARCAVSSVGVNSLTEGLVRNWSRSDLVAILWPSSVALVASASACAA